MPRSIQKGQRGQRHENPDQGGAPVLAEKTAPPPPPFLSNPKKGHFEKMVPFGNAKRTRLDPCKRKCYHIFIQFHMRRTFSDVGNVQNGDTGIEYQGSCSAIRLFTNVDSQVGSERRASSLHLRRDWRASRTHEGEQKPRPGSLLLCSRTWIRISQPYSGVREAA